MIRVFLNNCLCLFTLSMCVMTMLCGRVTYGQTIDLYLIAGQSNADGRAPTDDLSAELSTPDPSIQVFVNDNWHALQPGLNNSDNSDWFGPEISFGRAVAQDFSNRTIALVKVAVGSTDLGLMWKAPDSQGDNAGPLYIKFMSALRKAVLSFPKETTIYIRGMIWMQGETDAWYEDPSMALAYEDNLTAFINSVRNDLDMPTLPISVGLIGKNWRHQAIVRAAQSNVSSNMEHVGLVETIDLSLLVDGAHYDAVSQVMLGERFGKSIVETEASAPAPEPATVATFIYPSIFLTWNFDNWSEGDIPGWTVVKDISGNHRGGYAFPGIGKLTCVPSTLVSDPANKAVRFDTLHVKARLNADFTVGSAKLPFGIFSNGVTSRVSVQIDKAVAWAGNDYYQFLSRYRLGDGNDLFGLKYYAAGGVVIEACVQTSTGIQQLQVTQAIIESQLGYSIIGRAVVYAMTWDADNDNLGLYIDGQNVGNLSTTGDIALGNGVFIVGNMGPAEDWSRQGIYDDVKVWDGALTASEVMADYRTLVPLMGTTTNLLLCSEADSLPRNSIKRKKKR